MERNNESSLDSQRRRRGIRQSAENKIDAIDEKIDQYKDYKSSGRMDSTKGRLGSRAINDAIDRLENEKQKAQDQLDLDLEKDRQRGGGGQDASAGLGGTLPSFEEREAEAGLTDTMSGRGQSDPSMDERESAAGLRGTTAGRDFPDDTQGQTTGEDGELPDEKDNDDPLGTFGVIICINGEAYSASIYGQIGGKL